MGLRRNFFKNQHSTSKTPRIQSRIDDRPTKNDDGFMKFGWISLSDEKTSEMEIEENETEQNQPAKLTQ